MITGSQLRDAFISAANNIGNLRQSVDALNVFPVPDGDTGTNMYMTISAAKRELERLPDSVTASEVAGSAASALLRGARGNSGVILSLLFRGFSKGLHDQQEMTSGGIVDALQRGVSAAYKAVMKPTEGTILTVARMAAEHAAAVLEKQPEISPVQMWDEVIASAKDALEQTPELLPVLKKAGVVDAGGRGFVVILEGMRSVFQEGKIIELKEQETKVSETGMPVEKNAAGEYEGEITFTYCTEFIVIKDTERTDLNVSALRSYLESIGDSVVVVEDDDIIKSHVHTDNPGNALQKALEYGMLTNMKIENMREQHANQKKTVQPEETTFSYAAVDPSNEYGFVAVAAGEGLKQLFCDLGVNNVVSGGQTMNPSTDEILGAIQATPCKTVFVLPNNKNIIMAAEQTIKLADRKVIVLPTRTIPQGISAMLAFDPDETEEANHIAMNKAVEKVQTGQITFAARDSDFDGQKIKQGELLALENGKITFTEKDLTKTVMKLTRNLLRNHPSKEECFVTMYYGSDVTDEQAEAIYQAVAAKMPQEVELNLISGGQPVYYFIISAE